MVEPLSLEAEIDAQNKANLELLEIIESTAFQKFHFESDSILHRLPEGMQPGDTIESHKAKCQESMTETHQFETREFAEKFIKIRFAGYKVKEETTEHRIYVCPHGRPERCTGYVKLFLNLAGANVLRAHYGHYGHDPALGQPRFTGIQFATIRLYCDFYWKNIVGVEWNIHNLVYCFKQWYDDTHTLHYLNSYDIRAIAAELRRADAADLKLTNGVYHSVKHPTAALSTSGSSTSTDPTAQENVSASNPNGEGSSGPLPTPLSLIDQDEDDDDDEESLPERSSSPNPLLASALTDWILDDSRYHLVIQMWHNILFYATELKNITYMKIITPTSSMTTENYNDAQQIFEMLNQAAEIAQKMISKITEFKEQPDRSSSGEYRNMFSNCLFPNRGSPEQQSDNESETGSTGVPEPGVTLEFGPNTLYQQQSSLLHQVYMGRNATVEATIAQMKEQDFQTYEHHRKTNKNIFAMPLPNGTYIPSRLWYMTGINFKRKMDEMRERERIAFEQEVLDNMRGLHEHGDAGGSDAGGSTDDETETNEQHGNFRKNIGYARKTNGHNCNARNNNSQNEAHVHLTKNQKKKLKKKEKIRKAAEETAAALLSTLTRKKEQPLRHFGS
uniref:RING-type E3 ubiquitin transferase n=1 Tax=Caenorhabditis tropicalis TaxID=1561998 RepID=A0A1I7TCR1_9PELO